MVAEEAPQQTVSKMALAAVSAPMFTAEATERLRKQVAKAEKVGCFGGTLPCPAQSSWPCSALPRVLAEKLLFTPMYVLHTPTFSASVPIRLPC